MLATVLVIALIGSAIDAPTRTEAIVRGAWTVRWPARAALQPPGSSIGRETEAAAAFAAGEGSYERGRYRDAARHFARAHALVPHPATLYNLGLAQARSGDPVRAWQTFDRLSTEAQSDNDRREAELAKQRLRGRVAVLDISAPSGTAVCIDGRLIDLGPDHHTEHVVEPGSHRLASDGVESRLDLEPGETRAVDLEASLALDRMRHTSRATTPLLATSAIAAGAATGLGIAAATASSERTGRGLAAGAAVAGGIALGTAIAAIVVHTRRNRPATARSPNRLCP
jgi:tetratricopeptide (TPR) repeat protein